MTRLLILAAAAALAGCSTLDRVMENRVACSLDRTQGAFISWYGPLGISAKIAEADAKVMCEAVPVILQVAPRTGTGT
ncbi:MAG: hypothetical protein JNN18_13080 [Rubrivivax sp.]|nr:hypothetical protein [Rubrivivax sp.]